MGSILALLLLLPASSEEKVVSVAVAVTGEDGAPLTGLGTEEVAVLENGVVRELQKVEPDTRPVTLAVLVDTSQAVASALRLHVLDSLGPLVSRLPEGSRFAVWTTGDRPRKVVDFTDDPAALSALRRVAPSGGNTLLEAIVEAARELKAEEGRRSVMVAISSVGVEFSGIDRYRVVDEAQKAKALFEAVQYEEADGGFDERQKYEYVFANLTKKTGGLYETTLSSMGVDSAVKKVAADIVGQYRLTYLSQPSAKPPKIEVKVARPGAKVRLTSAPGAAR
jgi:VWFA-related protein